MTADELKALAADEEDAANARLRAHFDHYDGIMKRWAFWNLLWSITLLGGLLWKALQ